MTLIPRTIITFSFLFIITLSANSQVYFGAWYTKIIRGQKWEEYSCTGEHSDIIVTISKACGNLVFWRGNSYLPYWKTSKGQWDLTEIIRRCGDGISPLTDRANVYSHAEIIESNRGDSHSAGITANGVAVNPGPEFRQGKIIDTDGTYTMIIWVGISATSLQDFKIIRN